MPAAVLSLPFDSPGAGEVRLMQEAARLGELQVLLWSDRLVRARTGREPRMPAEERLYFLRAVRFVARAALVDDPLDLAALPARPDLWVVDGRSGRPAPDAVPAGLRPWVLGDADLAGFPPAAQEPLQPGRSKVLVTGSFDWLHSGHVRFFEEVAELGELHAVVGHDRNIRLLKGEGHPLFPEQERAYLVGAIRHVRRVCVSTGDGWLDAEPEIERIRPDIYAVNEDGHKPEKERYCLEHGIEYRVLKRLPKPGLTVRSSTELRGF